MLDLPASTTHTDPHVYEPPPRSGSARAPAVREEVDALEGMARALTQTGEYKVVRLFRRRERYAAEDGRPKYKALFVDVETTGLDPATDAIIELAAVPFEYGAEDGRIYGVGEAVSFLEDPGRPIPDDVVALTGITGKMVRGQRIDDARVTALLAGVSLVVAHNASFDRPLVERRLPAFARVNWACSQREVRWRALGCGSEKLDYLLFQCCAEFFAGHRAADDCSVGVHVLATRTPSGALPFAELLRSAREATVRVWATGAPIGVKDQLKARGYRWNPGEDGRARAWWRDVPEANAKRECEWLSGVAYGGRTEGWVTQRVTARERWSGRG